MGNFMNLLSSKSSTKAEAIISKLDVRISDLDKTIETKIEQAHQAKQTGQLEMGARLLQDIITDKNSRGKLMTLRTRLRQHMQTVQAAKIAKEYIDVVSELTGSKNTTLNHNKADNAADVFRNMESEVTLFTEELDNHSYMDSMQYQGSYDESDFDKLMEKALGKSIVSQTHTTDKIHQPHISNQMTQLNTSTSTTGTINTIDDLRREYSEIYYQAKTKALFVASHPLPTQTQSHSSQLIHIQS